MRCHYDVLEIERNADPKEIKLAYRRCALQWHPDKNPNNQEEAEIRFKEITEAYTILSDPQERAWYDNHRESILQGKDAEQGEKQDAVNLWGFFSDSCFNGFDKQNENNFYQVYADIFEELERVEMEESEDNIDSKPYFGNEESDLDDVYLFYTTWEAFSSTRSFGWCDKYKLSEAPSRQVKRLMEKENKKIRDAERKKFSKTVRALVLFAKKRDPRWEQYVEDEKDKRAKKKAVVNKKKQDRMNKKKEKLKEYQKAYEEEMEALDLDELGLDPLGEENGDAEKEELYCLVCKKNFRSANQWKNHEKSKKHLEAIERVRETLMFDDEILDSVVAINEDEEFDCEDAASEEKDFGSCEEDSPASDDLSVSGEENNVHHDDLDEESKHVTQEIEILPEEDEEEEEEEELVLTSFRSKKNKKKQRKQQKRKQFEQSAQQEEKRETEQVPDDITAADPVEDEDEVEDIPQPVKKKKARRAKKNKQKKEQQAALTPAAPGTLSQKCATCNSTFPTRNKLFNHVKKTGHAKPLK